MTVKTKKAAKRKARKPMFRAEPAGERTVQLPKDWLTKDGMDPEPLIRCYVRSSSGKPAKRWRVDLRDCPGAVSGVDLVAVDEQTGELICYLASISPQGIYRSVDVAQILQGDGYELQYMPFDDRGRIRLADD